MWTRYLRRSAVLAVVVLAPLGCEGGKQKAATPRGRAASDGGAQLGPPARPLRSDADLAAFVNATPGQPLVARGERWVYALRWSQLSVAELTDLERGLTLFGGGVKDGERVEAITSVGVREVRFNRLDPGQVHGSLDEWKFRPDLTATRSRRPPYVSAARETLSVSGRNLPCVVLGDEKPNGRVDRTWIHVGDGDVVLFPGVVKQESAGKVVLELTRIERAPEGARKLDLARLARIGEKWVYVERNRGEQEVVWTVTGMLGEEVWTSGERGSGRGWRWNGEPFQGQIVGRETVTVSGRAFPCIVVREYRHGKEPDRKWFHVDPDGVILFPGAVRWERDGVLVEELVRIEGP